VRLAPPLIPPAKNAGGGGLDARLQWLWDAMHPLLLDT
jgi:hypothetical protein